MTVLISIVSHNNQADISESGLLDSFDGLSVILRENHSNALEIFGATSILGYCRNVNSRGFGANHNNNFECFQAREFDWFVICNPDIFISRERLDELIFLAESDGASIAAPSLWNSDSKRLDDNVRPFPRLTSLALSLLGFPQLSRYDSETLVSLKNPDWASGAFLLVKPDLFSSLYGFDERYFMYMEDVDFCKRARKKGHRVFYYHSVQAIHNASRSSRRLFSKNFRYHLVSIFKYFCKRI